MSCSPVDGWVDTVPSVLCGRLLARFGGLKRQAWTETGADVVLRQLVTRLAARSGKLACQHALAKRAGRAH